MAAGWQWYTCGTEIGHLVTYKSGSNEEWTLDEVAKFQMSVLCHALVDILPDDGLPTILKDLGTLFGGYQVEQGVISLNDEDPYANPTIPDRIRKESAKLLKSVLRARAVELEEREE